VAALIASVIFILVFVAISFRLLHETAGALLGAAAVFMVTYIGGRFYPALRILNFEDAMTFVDWNVIFLILGMMIFMAVLAETNVFKWLAFRLYRAAKGNTWRLVAGLLLLTAVGSAFLNDVTVILLLVPLSIQLAVAIGIHPFVLVIPEVLMSNIGGAATLIGDPPSTIVGSHIGMSFAEYMVNMAPIAGICVLAAMMIIRYQYRKEYARSGKKVSPVLLEALVSDSHIKNKATLYKALAVASLTFAGFFAADLFDRMPPGVMALSGAALLMAWVRPDMHSMMREVDWTTLLFFIGLFIVVGGMEKTGAIEWLATRVAILAGESVKLAALLTTWVAGIGSGFLANIPFTVAALPVADFLTETLPGAAESKIIYWALILGADLGGNATILGSAPNIVALGLLGQAGFRLTFGRFLRDALPVTIVTMILASIWLLIRY